MIERNGNGLNGLYLIYRRQTVSKWIIIIVGDRDSLWDDPETVSKWIIVIGDRDSLMEWFE